MSKLESTVNEILQDLKSSEMPRQEFLALCAKQRIDELNRSYDEDFDRLLELLEQKETSQTDITKISQSIKKYSETISVLYSSLTRQLELCQKNIFDKSDQV